MKKLLTLVAAAFMAVSVSAANKVLKITGIADKANPWDIQCFINLKNLEKGKAYVVKFDVYTTAGTEFTIGTQAINETQTEHKTVWNASAVFSDTDNLTLPKTKSEAVINFPGKTTVTCHSHCKAKPGMTINHDGGNIETCDPEILENYEYAATALLLNIGKLPKDAVIYIGSIKVYDADGNLCSTENFDDATVGENDTNKTIHYPGWQKAATFEIADENATYFSSVDLADIDFSASDANKIGGWGGGFHSEINKTDGVDVITFTKQNYAHEVQVDFENVYPKGAKIRLTMVAKGDGKGSINAVLQNPDNYKECSTYEDITLATGDFQPIEKTFTCFGDNARRLLLNVGTYEGTIYIKSVKIEALQVPQETVTISPSGYSTYAAYYPVDYSKLGLTAYTVKLNEKKTGIVMNEVKGVVPAGVAVLLKGEANKDYALPKDEGGENVTSDLKLSDGTATSYKKTVTSSSEKIPVAVYGLATVNGQDGFYKASEGKTIPTKCAYLEVENPTPTSSAKFYSLGDQSGSTTGITSVKNEAAGNNAPMYNLAGQLVDKGYKGIVIKNGKKIVLK
ncbi:hypothetical protein FYJ72_07665 [Prevotella copri]|uniref:CBM6 domain-containing protein n=1 Tax=Segatella copri TaxID=165179 RepID=A0A6I2TYD7_9BACT|nr:hypothetical protein [Segatella copri]MST77557.1 hypothetical protein [Segatella copri]